MANNNMVIYYLIHPPSDPIPNVTKLSCIQAHRVFSRCFAWCPCKAINVSVQCNGGFLPDMTLLTLCLPSRNPIKCHEEVLSLQPMFLSTKIKLSGGYSESLDAFRFFFIYKNWFCHEWKSRLRTSSDLRHYQSGMLCYCEVAERRRSAWSRFGISHCLLQKQDWRLPQQRQQFSYEQSKGYESDHKETRP